jgi:AcrR family transcriptional regulator
MTGGQICPVVNKSPTLKQAEPVGRRERKRVETREKLFQTAVMLFAKNGFAATRVEEITEAADVAKGTFFNYFPSKEHLLMHFAGRQIGIVQRCLESARAGKEPMPVLLLDMANELTSLPGRSPELARSVMTAFLSNEEVRQVMREEIAGRARRILADVLAIGQKRGEVRTDRTALEVARSFQQSLFGTVLLWSLNPSEPLTEVVGCTVDVAWNGMKATSNGEKPKKRRVRASGKKDAK